jgi:hypothetical protein
MTEAFRTAIERIHKQKAVFPDLEEKAIEFGVVLPLLKQVGWNTDDVTEVYPQRTIPNVGKPDFDLQIGGNSRVIIEVKRWTHHLDSGNEDQLKKYCAAVKPRLAVLTNGHEWLMYVEPWTRLKQGKLHRFLDFSIDDEPWDLERDFRRFLGRENLEEKQAADATARAAKELFRSKRDDDGKIEELTKAWNNLATDKDALLGAVTTLGEHWEIRATEAQVKKFLAKAGPLVSTVADNCNPPNSQRHIKPESFTFAPENVEPRVEKVSDWTGVRLGVCKLMIDRHCKTPGDIVPEFPEGWFFESDGQYRRPIGNTGIYVPTGGNRHQILQACTDILAKFGYHANSLTVQYKEW